MNFGFQREIRHGMVFTADFLRNVETHGLLGVRYQQSWHSEQLQRYWCGGGC